MRSSQRHRLVEIILADRTSWDICGHRSLSCERVREKASRSCYGPGGRRFWEKRATISLGYNRVMPRPAFDALEIALQHQRAGRVAEAEAIYRQILGQEPGHPDALHWLGVIALQRGDVETAEALLRRAIEANPRVAAFHGNLAL